MICILHGYLLEGSGSNLWTRSIVESLCRQGETVHLMAQENHPERYEFISEARFYRPDGTVETRFRRAPSTSGCCILHQPDLGDTLPVYVWDKYEEFPRVVPLVDLPDDEVEEYVQRNTRALLRIVKEQGITAIHANHAVLMSVVAQRVKAATGVPFSIMPHGSALEFAVKRQKRYHTMAVSAFTDASLVFVHGDEMRQRVRTILGDVPGLEDKFMDLHLGVDTSQFQPVPRSGRREMAARMAAVLADTPRGRQPGHSEPMLARLRGGMGHDELRELLAEEPAYDGKAPDAEVEARLDAIHWESDPTLLFVGRLISTKGIQGVVAALPFILRERPEMRLIIVGHGPLRRPLEALLWALEHGERELVQTIVAWGRDLEGAPEGESEGAELTQVARFLEQVEARGELDAYYQAARDHVRPDRVIFTGYLTHRELAFLFPCCDAAVFPSVVKEAGPLVFLEALAAGSFPLGTYFAGMKASIDAVADSLPAGDGDAMKLDPATERTVADIVRRVPAALDMGEKHKETLYRVARERFDWTSVARTLHQELNEL
ncbi:glycosyltransferase [Longimicrobium terrae]|uniref:Glycosyltransferase involved in cell wall biosynthesis n=1 Tax=Longimicrobium terrae TaxID=1639882 RepID=A0A841H2M7_9BACT|nr:glycosyltransferase [Longimicrobium terrae]MBB4637971.1 glycosyltransferase involved in cell wall biosynthesis [Longimicrobium terrae]MBB6072218.1 glycosyltransferase involved in cell wall biosynthesis [Longimicrobium terrae]NNC28356.1 glycosyltransferase [Longimicrobium terrae]